MIMSEAVDGGGPVVRIGRRRIDDPHPHVGPSALDGREAAFGSGTGKRSAYNHTPKRGRESETYIAIETAINIEMARVPLFKRGYPI